MEPNGNRNARIWHDYGLLLERMYLVLTDFVALL